ncbi:hypothetical protein PS15m_000149 [Mucor circinelloides]
MVVLNQLNTLKHSLRHAPDFHKKDLLCYSIIDLVSSKKQSVHKALTTAQIEKCKQDYKSNFFVSEEASLFTKKIMKRAKSTSLKQALKNTKNAINLQPDTPLKAQTHAICKIVKTFAAALENNGNKLNGSCNETKYTFFFLYPVIKHLLYSAPFNFKLGESHLQCAIKTTDDDEAADAGPKIDIIMSHKENGLALSVVEVSGPNYKTNKNHFVGDRNKITKNLKAILRQIQKTCSAPDIVAFKKIKVYGLQVYKNKLYIYSLSQISFSYYLFILEKTIEIPSSPGLLYQQLPGFLASISYLVNIYEDMNANIMKFFDDSNTHAMPIYSNSEASTPNVSPKKQKLSRSSAQ